MIPISVYFQKNDICITRRHTQSQRMFQRSLQQLRHEISPGPQKLLNEK